MTKAEEKYHAIADSLPDAKKGKMFGKQCIKAPNGKALAMLFHESMVFKLPKDLESEALGLDGAKPFEPAPGRKMGGWTEVPYAHAHRWQDFAEAAMELVKALR